MELVCKIWFVVFDNAKLDRVYYVYKQKKIITWTAILTNILRNPLFIVTQPKRGGNNSFNIDFKLSFIIIKN